MILGTSHHRIPINGKSMSFAADFRAKISAQPIRLAKASMVHAADSGRNTSELFAYFDPDLSSWRTSQISLFGESEPYLGKWPRSGLMRSGRVFRLAPLVRRISGTEFTFLPTPMSAERRSYQRDQGKRGKERLTLLGIARLHYYGILATPNAGDWKAGYSDTPTRRQKSLPRDVARLLGLISGKRGRLNPMKVGWMMGFPANWLSFLAEATETPSYLKSPNGLEGD